MYIRYKLYRSKYPDQVFNQEMIQFNLENDNHLIKIDDIMNQVLAYHIQNLPQVIKYGTAYIGRMEIVNIEITDNDTIDLSEEEFRHYMHTIMPYLQIIWNKTCNNIEDGKK